ncbi:MAG TPA: hypothetical protein DF296_06305 [Candidatus Margulisbacteria bacterium]|nr:hypothetical protein [Candidatus Margulisiibacteriota bacterium]
MADICYIENHYGVSKHEILAETRNTVCVANIAILNEIIKIIEPQSLVRIYLLPPREGSYQDVIKLITDNVTAERITALCAIAGLFLGVITYVDTRKINNIDYENKQLEFIEHMKTLGLTEDDLPSDSMKKLYNNIVVHKEKVKRYKALLKDKDVKTDTNIVKTSDFIQVQEAEVKRPDFPKYTIDIIQDKKLEPIYKLHQVKIDAPVITKDSDAMWRTRDIHTKEHISFHIADETFKENFFAGKYPLKEKSGDDIMIVHIEYLREFKDEEEVITRRNAVAVYQINEHKIAEIPAGLEFNNISYKKDPNQITIDEYIQGAIN